MQCSAECCLQGGGDSSLPVTTERVTLDFPLFFLFFFALLQQVGCKTTLSSLLCHPLPQTLRCCGSHVSSLQHCCGFFADPCSHPSTAANILLPFNHSLARGTGAEFNAVFFNSFPIYCVAVFFGGL